MSKSLLGRTTIIGLGMIPSTMHSAVLYQSEAGPRFIMSEYQDVRRKIASERAAAASKEVEEPRKERILKEIGYQTWIANTVMVKKTDEAWRMCVDVGIKSLLDAVWITAAHVCVNAAQLELVLLVNISAADELQRKYVK
ncbi:hypothetical protein Tco_1214696 [Tanacetum coccineum]